MSTTNGNSVPHPTPEEEPEEEEGPKSLPYLFEKELIEKQNRHIHLYDDFRATKKTRAPIDGKFFTHREQVILPSVSKHFEHLMQPRRERYTYVPHCQSQIYGWLPIAGNEANAERIRSDAWQINFISAPKRRCDMTIYGEKLFSERHTERPPFNGLRFLYNF